MIRSRKISRYLSLTSDGRDVTRFPNTGDFAIDFVQPIKLDPDYDWSIALDKAALWYSYPNVSDTVYSNAVFTYFNGAVTKSFTIPEGTYSFTDLNTAIQNEITALGDVGANISFLPNYNTQRVTVVLSGGYTWDPTTSELYKLFGFSDAQAAGIIVATTLADNLANITNSVTNLYVKLDILRETWENASGGQVLFSFLPSGPPGSIITLDPPERVYLQLQNRSELHQLRIYVQDNLQRNIDFRGESTAYTLHLVGVLRGT